MVMVMSISNYSVNGAAGIENHSTASFSVASLLLKSTLKSIHSPKFQIFNRTETTKQDVRNFTNVKSL